MLYELVYHDLGASCPMVPQLSHAIFFNLYGPPSYLVSVTPSHHQHHLTLLSHELFKFNVCFAKYLHNSNTHISNIFIPSINPFHKHQNPRKPKVKHNHLGQNYTNKVFIQDLLVRSQDLM